MAWRRTLLILLLALAVGLTVSDQVDDLIATTSYGSLRGYDVMSEGERVRVFKSVPFAAPPLGQLRWSLPQWPNAWSGVRDATVNAPDCMQNASSSSTKSKNISEDCLYMNIFTSDRCKLPTLCPVAIYLHGGGLLFGSAVNYNDSLVIRNFASRGVILVVPAYRVGFAHSVDFGDEQELVPSNLGVYDALHALRWVRDEISSFGGDPSSVSLFGHSYGSAIAMVLAWTPLRDVPLARMVTMSPEMYFAQPSMISNRTAVLVQELGCSRSNLSETLQCMRAVDAHDLLQAQTAFSEKAQTLSRITMRAPLIPWNTTAELLRHAPKIDILLGCTAREDDYEEAGYENGILLGLSNYHPLFDFYRELSADGLISEPHASGTISFFVGAWLYGHALKERGNNVFLYSYDQPTHNFHTDDLSYLIGVHGFEQNENERVIADFYPRIFVDFIRNGSTPPAWHQLDASDAYYSIAVDVETGRRPEMRSHFQHETIQFWTGIAPVLDRMMGNSSSIHLSFTSSDPAGDSPVAFTISGLLLLAVGALAVFALAVMGAIVVQRLTYRKGYSTLLDEGHPLLNNKGV